MKKFLQRLLQNAITDIKTTIVGSIAGAPDLWIGIQTKNAAQIVSGAAIVILGLLMKSN